MVLPFKVEIDPANVSESEAAQTNYALLRVIILGTDREC
jgi:hypothetical protein